LSSDATASNGGVHCTTALVLDDDRLLGWALQRQLAACGHPAHAVQTRAAAAAQLRLRAFEVVFLDVHLPDGCGVTLLPLVRATSPRAQIVVMSADASEGELALARAGGALFVEKPFDVAAVVRIVIQRAATGGSTRP
jgi:DNA-binding NtrC family response regulator